MLPVNPEGRVLLLHGWDPRHPDRPFWFTIGGGAEAGESLRDAGARELREETGIMVDPDCLGEPIAQNMVEFSWAGYHIIQDQTFYAVLVESAERDPRWHGLVGARHDRQVRLAVGRRPGTRPAARGSQPSRPDPRRRGQRPRSPAAAFVIWSGAGNSLGGTTGSPIRSVRDGRPR